MIWLYISELAGKDLEIAVIGRFILYASPNLIPLTLPLSILFTSIMVFGEFSEHFEFVAMKSTGISLQRAMRSLTIFIVFLSIATFFFANNVIPASQKKFIDLRRNIVKLKPARVIVANQFNEIGDINIKVGDKYGDNDQFLDEVVIHKRNPNKPGNFTVIKSEKGELVSSVNSNVLSLVLTNGNYYDEIQVKKAKEKKKLPFIKSDFKEYAINLDLSSFNDVDMSAESYIKNRKMLNISMLSKDIDSFELKLINDKAKFSKKLFTRLGIKRLNRNLSTKNCTIQEYPTSVTDIYSFKNRKKIYKDAIRNLERNATKTTTHQKEIATQTERINKFKVALHEKFALAFACIVLFFIGAPLGSIIRKGGLGLPLLYALGIFLAYHFIGIFAKNSAEDGSLHPFLASWFSTLIVLPLGILFTYRATTEKDLINFGDLFAKLFGFVKRIFKNPKDSNEKEIEPNYVLDFNESETGEFNRLSDDKLIDIARNYKQYDYSQTKLNKVLSILDKRGISVEELKNTGNLGNRIYEDASMIFNKFKKYSILTLVFYLLSGLLFFGVRLVLYSDLASRTVGELVYIMSIARPLVIITYLIFFVMSLLKLNEFNKTIKKEIDSGLQLAIWIFGFLIYVGAYFHFNKEMKEEMKKLR